MLPDFAPRSRLLADRMNVRQNIGLEPDHVRYSCSMLCVLDQQGIPPLKIFVIFDGNIVRVRKIFHFASSVSRNLKKFE